MPHDNTIEDKLRAQEAMQEPDLSQVDAHWQQMREMLQPAAVAPKRGWPQWMLNTFSVLAVSLLIIAAYLYLSVSKKPVAASVATPPPAEMVAQETGPTGVDIQMPVTAGDSNAVTKKQAYPKGQQTFSPAADNFDDAGSIFDSLTIRFTPCDACPQKKQGSALALSARQVLLKELLTRLQTAPDEYLVDNSRDTLLQLKEGAVLLIPAHGFGDVKDISFAATEYYSNTSLVLNQLSTASDKDQLVSGGMLHLQATYKGQPLDVQPGKAIQLFMPDSSGLEGMQLFEGVTQNGSLNWVPQGRFFNQFNLQTEVKVLNLVDQPLRVVDTKKGRIGYFIIDEDSLAVSKEELARMLRDKYGYYKVKFRSAERSWFSLRSVSTEQFSHLYGTRIGSSVWMDKRTADMYKLNPLAERKINVPAYLNQPGASGGEGYSAFLQTGFKKRDNKGTNDSAYQHLINDLSGRYAVDIQKLGWINCDRFYKDSRPKINFEVDLPDSATGYYTVLVFDNIKSMMTGYLSGNRVIFPNVPAGENVKLVSVGIGDGGEAIYSVTNTTTSIQPLTGLRFESLSVPGLEASLSKKMDQ